MANDFILTQIEALPAKFGLQWMGSDKKRAKIRCPIHKNGEETTPSLIVNVEDRLTDKGVFRAGSGRCMGCGVFFPSWKKLGAALGCHAIEENGEIAESEYAGKLIAAGADNVFLNDSDDSSTLPDYERMLPWIETDDWRTIKGSLVKDVGGKAFFNEKTEKLQLYLPVLLRKKHVGGVRANIIKQGKLNYFNTEGGWAKDFGLYPYDYTKSMLKRTGIKTLTLVEGARDALKTIQFGIPALGILGTGNWSDTKAELVLSLPIDQIILAFDPDEAGLMATKKVYKSLKGEIAIKKFTFDDGIDPGNMPKSVAKKLRAAATSKWG